MTLTERAVQSKPATAGFCLAAGAGRRLAPLTERTPKPLLAPAGRALVDLAVDGLAAAGALRTVVNAHHHADLLAAHLDGRPGVALVREPALLGTGGGLANAWRSGLLDADVVLVTCADVVADPADLRRLAAAVGPGGPDAAVGLVGAAEPPRLDLDRGLVRPEAHGRWASAGVYALTRGALERIAPGPSTLLDAVLAPLWERGRLAGVPLAGAWVDAGTLAGFLAAADGLLRARWPYALPTGRLRAAGPVFLAEGAEVHPAARLRETVVVDRGALVGEGALVRSSVLGPGSRVGAGAVVGGSVLGPGARVEPGASVDAALVGA